MSAETKSNYSPGLEGVIAGETAICWVDPDAGLLYRGYDIHELAAQAGFEEVAWLLLRGELPTLAELSGFSRELASCRPLPAKVAEVIRLIAAEAHPMDVLRTGVSLLGALDPDREDVSREANLRKSVRLIAQVSSLVTAAWQAARGRGPLPPKPELTHAANFLYEFSGAVPEPWQSEMFDTILVLYADHEFNASTFSARVTASTLADMHAAITSAVGTLKGPLHGGANEASLRMLEEIGSPERAEAWVMERLARKERIMGFGHRVYRQGDSRVPTMRALARSAGRRLGQEQWVPIGEKLEEVMNREKRLCANVDLYAGMVLRMLGIPAELNTPIFACARTSGWCAHVLEQQEHNRLIRPRSLYTGQPRRPYHSLARQAKAAA